MIKNLLDLLIDINFRAHAYVHIAEQLVGMEHRFFKNFSGMYVNKKGVKSKVNVEMYCRKLEDNIETFINPKFKNHLKKNNAITELKKKGIIFTLINAKKAHKLMVKDLKNKKKYIYPKNIKSKSFIYDVQQDIKISYDELDKKNKEFSKKKKK
jgi:hypothetical protein